MSHLDNKFKEEHRKRCQITLNELKKIIKSNSYFEYVAQKMIEEGIHSPIDAEDYPCKKIKQPKNIDELLDLILSVITTAPVYYTNTNPFNGLPLLNVFMHLMRNKNGMLLFGNVIFNKYLKRILNLWKEYLDHEVSCSVLPSPGWLSMSNIEEYKIDKKDKYYGFKSWNEFFTRRFADFDKSRPMADSLVISPCDFHLIRIKDALKLRGDFTDVKGDYYSLTDMLDGVNKEIVEKFIGGTLVQGFLNAENYHRYHAPVTGMLVDAHIARGSYYYIQNSEKELCGQQQVINSEEFLANVQTRAIFIFKTKEIGYVAMICVGMVEVSSCIINFDLIKQMVEKGQEVGKFQYGGSTILLIFEKAYADKIKIKLPKDSFNLEKEELTEVRSHFADLK